MTFNYVSTSSPQSQLRNHLDAANNNRQGIVKTWLAFASTTQLYAWVQQFF
jgi:hypothetical protein